MYDHKLVLASNVFELAMDIPDDTNADAAAGLRTGGQEGRLAITVRAVDAFTLAEDKTITMTLKDSSDDGDTDAYAVVAAPNPVPALVITATGGAVAYVANQVVMRMIIPAGLDKWVKPNIAVNDAAIDGETWDVFLEYLAN